MALHGLVSVQVILGFLMVVALVLIFPLQMHPGSIWAVVEVEVM
jgi:hypothetical protein